MISNPIIILGIKTIKANTNGSIWIHVKFNNWSNLNLGKLALTQIKINIITEAFNPKINDSIEINVGL